MADPATNPPSNIDAILARVRQANQPNSSPSASPAWSFHNVNTPGTQTAQLQSPRPYSQLANQPRSSSFTTSMSTAPAASSQGDRAASGTDPAANLLNLLRFNDNIANSSAAAPVRSTSYGTPRAASAAHAPSSSVSGRGPSQSDLVASFMGRNTMQFSPGPSASATSPMRTSSHPRPTSSSSRNPQEFLLRMLEDQRQGASRPYGTESSPNQRSKSPGDIDLARLAQGLANASIEPEPSPPASSAVQKDSPSRTDSPLRVFGSRESREATPFEPQIDQPEKESIFTYKNPFDELAASRPHSGQKIARSQEREINGSRTEHFGKEPSPEPSPEPPRKKHFSGDNKVMKSVEDSGNEQGISKKTEDTLLGLKAPTTDPATVAQAVSEVGKHVSRQVDRTLGEDDPTAEVSASVLDKAGSEPRDATLVSGLPVSPEPKEDPMKIEQARHVEASVANGVGEAAAEDGGGSEIERIDVKSDVPVFNLPMRPFVSIDLISQELPALQFDQSSITEIARLKKEFDQIDRTLATASNEYILYAVVKPGGVRIIRQEDGFDRKVFQHVRDNVFNVSISTSDPKATTPVQTFIATAVSGSVYWGQISRDGEEFILDEDYEQHCLTFPPVPVHDDSTSGGQLKTRAKKSSRHPEFFAIGRGRTIQIVFPFHAKQSSAIDGETRVVDPVKYLRDRNLRIFTGKAGKDFTFSEDDTVIASLDKAGRLRFWDIRELTNEANGQAGTKVAPVDIKVPTLTFGTAVANEKSWPTSVLFVDKQRPYVKNCALRYVIVGMKQNHTLQLWDLGLGKAVQEVNFPHEKESDAICSVCYHPSTGILVVGHPTRNSIYFIHLSIPRYQIPAMPQAQYVQRLADKDSKLPKPESTAIMGGIREFSFSSTAKGQLRSVDILPTAPDSSRNADAAEDPTLFELYAMHAKGVTCLAIKRADVGWDSENKVICPVDAEKEGYIRVKELRDTTTSPESSTPSVNGDTASRPSVPSLDVRGSLRDDPPIPVKDRQEAMETFSVVSKEGERAEKKKKRRAAAAQSEVLPPPAPEAPSATPTSYAAAAAKPPSSRAASSKESIRSNSSKSTREADAGSESMLAKDPKSKRESTAPGNISMSVSSDFLDQEIKKIERIVATEFDKALTKQLGELYRKFEEDRRVADASGVARQESILRLVSKTLTENVDATLNDIISKNVEGKIVPAVNKLLPSIIEKIVAPAINQALEKKIISAVSKQISASIESKLVPTISRNIPSVMEKILPEAINKHLNVALPQHLAELKEATPQAFRDVMNDPTTTTLFSHKVVEALQAPATTTAISETISDKVAHRIYSHLKAEISDPLVGIRQQLNNLHMNDAAKWDETHNMLHSLGDGIRGLVTMQDDLRNQVLRLQAEVAYLRQDDPQSGPRGPPSGYGYSTGFRQAPQAPKQRDFPPDPNLQPGPQDVVPVAATPRRTPPAALPPEMAESSRPRETLEDEVRNCHELFTQGKYEDATINWLSSYFQPRLFDAYWVNVDPGYLYGCQPLLVLSVGAAVTASFRQNLSRRLDWVDVVLDSTDPKSPDGAEVGRQIMDVLAGRLDGERRHQMQNNPSSLEINRLRLQADKARQLSNIAGKAYVPSRSP